MSVEDRVKKLTRHHRNIECLIRYSDGLAKCEVNFYNGTIGNPRQTLNQSFVNVCPIGKEDEAMTASLDAFEQAGLLESERHGREK